MANQDIRVEGKPGCVAWAPEVKKLLVTSNLKPDDGIAVDRVYIFHTDTWENPSVFEMPRFEDACTTHDSFIPISDKTEDKRETPAQPVDENLVFSERCSVSSDGRYAVIAEKSGPAREMILDIQQERFLHKVEDAFTLIAQDNKTFVSFVQTDSALYVNILRPIRNSETDKMVLEKVVQLRLGEKLVGWPKVMSDANFIAFAQTSKPYDFEVCVLDIKSEPEEIVCTANETTLGLANGDVVKDIQLTADGKQIWVVYQAVKGTGDDIGAVLWKPKLSSDDNDSGKVIAHLQNVSEFTRLNVTGVEEDFDRLNFVMKGSKFSIHLTEWLAEFSQKFGGENVNLWLSRKKSSNKVDGCVIQYTGQDNAVVCTSDSLYLVGWNESKMLQKIKYATTTVRHMVPLNDERVVLLFEDGTINDYMISTLTVRAGKQPLRIQGTSDYNRAPRAPRAAMCNIL